MSKLNELAENELAAFRQHQALVSLHQSKAETHLERFLAAVNLSDGGPLPAGLSNVKCVRVWTEWLRDNGPNLKTVITEETGVKFTEHGTPFTIKWFDYLADRENSVSDDTIVRFNGYRVDGRGGAPVIYALWSQRYDVRNKFGVGPVRPDDTLLGVVQPDPDPETWDGAEPVRGPWLDEMAVEDPPIETVPWEEQHHDVLLLAAQGLRPTPEQFAILRSTHPDGPQAANLAVAMAGKGTRPEME